MLDFESGFFVKLDLGFTPSPSGGGMSLFQAENAGDAFIVLQGYTPGLDATDRKESTALVVVTGLEQSVYGYPNEEAFWFDQRGDVGHGFYELEGSRWHENVMSYNDRTYGSRHPKWRSRYRRDSTHHFFVGSKDSSAQFLAEGLRVESFTDRPYRAVQVEAIRRLDDWFNWRHNNGRPVAPGIELVRSYPDQQL